MAIVPDGNGRWATARGLPRSDGHRAGVDAVCRAVRAAPALGIRTLTIHALSSDNWRRPEPEVAAILACIRMFLELETPGCVEEGVRVSVLGRRDRLPPGVARAVAECERATARGTRLDLRLAVDYSARAAIRAAMAEPSASGRDPTVAWPDVDLLIRTGGELRLGDFLLWECAYAELVFLATPWPDFGGRELAAAVAELGRRERRFGGLAVERGDSPGTSPPLERGLTPATHEPPFGGIGNR